VLRSRYLLASIAGLMLAASFPKIGIAGFAWVAPALILVAAMGKHGWERFRIGYVAGLTHYLTSLYWLLLIPYRWHGIPLAPALGWLALSAFIALYPATWVFLLSEIQNWNPGGFGATGSGPKSIFAYRPVSMLEDQNPGSSAGTPTWAARALWCLSGAALWVALEMVVARLFTGFPWNLLGASQYQMVPLIQISSITGIYGVAFLVVWGSLSLLSAGLKVLRQPALRSAWVREIILPFGALFGVFVFGFHQLKQSSPAERTLKVTMVQPSIPQTLIWDESKDEERFQELVHLSEQALTNKTDLLIWPEDAVPKLLRYDKDTFAAVTNLAGSHHVWIIVGADDMELLPEPGNPEHREFYNSSFLISPEGHLVGRYRKRALVIFGEYVPLVKWVPFGKWFTPTDSGFTSGDKAVNFELTNPGVNTSVLICFEDIFPHLAREYAGDETDFLVNITNNGWFGEGAAQWQQGTSALFRAVENGLPLVRCSNNGLTCWADSHGRLVQLFRDSAGTVYGPGFLQAEIPLLAPGEKHAATYYNRHGDVFGWVCVAWAGVMVLKRILRR